MNLPAQGELFALCWKEPDPLRLHVNDVIRIDGRLGRVIRVNDCAAVVLMHRPAREFTTRFDKHVHFQPSATTFRISTHAETEVLNRHPRPKRKSPERRT